MKMQIFLDFVEMISFWKCQDFTHRKYYKTTSTYFITRNEDKCKVHPRTGHEGPEKGG
jgi:hypothetical protein